VKIVEEGDPFSLEAAAGANENSVCNLSTPVAF
jgi:hypothetical protein